MARIAFVQNLAFEYLGVMFISSILKKNGHSVEVFIGNNLKKIADEVKAYRAEIVGFPCLTGNHHWCLKASEVIKAKTSVLTIFGGPHPTFFPEIIMEPQVDIICRGEAEIAFLELANRFDNKDDMTKVSNCWFKHDSRILKNDLMPLIEDLDSLPFPDRDTYYKKYPFLNKSQKVFIAGRGCPFKCSYCFNDSLQALYLGKGKYIRYRSVNNLLAEIKSVYKKYGIETVYMVDDTFIINVDWLYEFLGRYSKEVRLPLICLIRVDLLTEDIVKRLKDANCYSVFFGIESGNESLRKEILGKYISDKQIITAAGLLKKYGIKFRTYNMLGIPGETFSDALQTIKINIKINTDYPWCSVLQPYPKTKIEEYARRKNLLSSKSSKTFFISSSFFRDSVIDSKYKKILVNLQKLFFFAVKFPTLLFIIKILVRFPTNLFFNLAFMIGYAYSYRNSEHLKWQEFLNLGLRNYRALLAK